MDEQWLAEQPVEPDAEPPPRVTWEDVWGGLGAGKASDGNLALAFEEIDADEWGFAVGTSAAEDRSDEPVRVALDDDEPLDGWEIPALGSFDAIVDPSPAYDEDVDRGGLGPAGDLDGFDLELDDEPSGPLAFSSPSAPPAWRPNLDEPEPDSPPEVSSPPAMDAPSVRAQAAPAPVLPPTFTAPAPAAAPVAVAVAPGPVVAAPAPAPAPAPRRSVEDIFGDDLFDDDEDDEDEEPRGAPVDPFAGAADLPERWTYSARRKLTGRRRRSERSRTARPRKARRRERRSTFKEVPFDPGTAPIGDDEAHGPAGRTPQDRAPAGLAPQDRAPAGLAPQDRGPAGRASEDRAPAGRGRPRRGGRHRRGLVEVDDATPRRTRRVRSSIVRVLGVSVPVAAAVITYLRLS